mgnify:CR=1 FL=1
MEMKDIMNNQLILDCSVCLMEIVDPISLKECMHAFCKECCIKMLKESKLIVCPLCKEKSNYILGAQELKINK